MINSTQLEIDLVDFIDSQSKRKKLKPMYKWFMFDSYEKSEWKKLNMYQIKQYLKECISVLDDCVLIELVEDLKIKL